jgi:hypothetical protein
MNEARTPPATPPAWTGWYRASKYERWVKMSEAPTYDGALGLLLDRRPAGARRAELLVTDATKDPNDAEPAGRRW